MNQKNANKVWKCSGRQTLPFGIIVQHNKNTFVWCQIKRTKMPFYGILDYCNIGSPKKLANPNN